LHTEDQVRSAYRSALEEGSGVLVEQFAPGYDHRLLVVGDRVVAATRGEPTYVTGDGERSIAQLIDDDLNRDLRRGELEAFPLCEIELDPTNLLQLSRQGHTQDSIPRHGERVLIQRNGNLSFDVTDDIHPEVATVAVQAAKIIGLDVAGLDLVMPDISKPLESQGGVVIEVNAGPGLLMHLKPLVGKPRPVGEAIIECMFGEQSDGRMPVVAIAGSQESTQAARLIHGMLNRTGKRTALACSAGHFVGEREITGFDSTSSEALQAMLLNPLAEALVCEATAENILREGLGVDRCQIGIVTHIDDSERATHFGIDTTEKMAAVYRTVIDVVLPTGFAVLNADELPVAEMASSCRGQTVLFSLYSTSSSSIGHRERGGRVVLFEEDKIVLAEGANVVGSVDLSGLSLVGDRTKNPLASYGVLAAIGAAWVAGVPVPIMQDVLYQQLRIETCAEGGVA
jgi:cyanophycin synthetase